MRPYRPWIKLYIEMLDDPKIGKLPEWLRWRAVAMFLLAGELQENGILPPVEDMQWRLRLDDEQMRETLRRLTEIGVVCQDDTTRWQVVHFAERQNADTSTERVQRFRDRETKLKRNVTENETILKRNETHIEVEVEEELSSTTTTAGANLAQFPTGYQVVCELAHWPDIPPIQLSKIEECLNILTLRHKTKAALTEHCKPFAEEYYRRYPARTSAGWLDWAVMGMIPEQRYKGTSRGAPAQYPARKPNSASAADVLAALGGDNNAKSGLAP